MSLASAAPHDPRRGPDRDAAHAARRSPRCSYPLASLGRRLRRRGLFEPQTRLGRLTAAAGHAVRRRSSARATPSGAATGRSSRRSATSSRASCATVPPDAGAGSPQLRRVSRAAEGAATRPTVSAICARAFTRLRPRRRDDRRAAPRAAARCSPNLRIGLHEQTRLQPEIRESLDAPDAVGPGPRPRAACARSARPVGRRRARAPSRSRAPPGALGDARAARDWRDMLLEIITSSVMVMSLPGHVLAARRVDPWTSHFARRCGSQRRRSWPRRAGASSRRAGARRHRRARLVGLRPAHALHRPPVPRLSPARGAARAAVHARAGAGVRARRSVAGVV